MSLNLKQHLNDLIHIGVSDPVAHLNSLWGKLFTWIGGASVAYQASPEVSDYMPEFILPFADWLWSIDWLNTFTVYAMFALGVERSFVIWAWYRRVKRGDYNNGKP